MKNPWLKAALLLLLCAGRAAALGKGQTVAHTHDTAARGGSTLRPAVLSMTASSTATFAGHVDVPVGAVCTGLGCRVSYSSGTLNVISVVFYATTTYNLEFSATITSGTSSGANVRCTVNGDATAGNYFGGLYGYPNAYSWSSQGTVAYFDVLESAGGGIAAGAFFKGSFHVSSPQSLSNRFVMTGTIGSLLQAALFNHYTASYAYKGNGPWTLKCWPVAGVGWNHEAILYEVGK